MSLSDLGFEEFKGRDPRWVWWSVLVISVVGRQRQEDVEFKVSIGFIAKQKEGNPRLW